MVDRWPILPSQLEAFDLALILAAHQGDGKVINLDSGSPHYVQDLLRLPSSLPPGDMNYLRGIPRIQKLQIRSNPAMVGKQLDRLRQDDLLIIVTGSDNPEIGLTAGFYPVLRKPRREK